MKPILKQLNIDPFDEQGESVLPITLISQFLETKAGQNTFLLFSEGKISYGELIHSIMQKKK